MRFFFYFFFFFSSRRRHTRCALVTGVQTCALPIFSFLTVQENVETPLLEHARLPKGFVRDLARLKIALAGLPDNAGSLKPAELSGGKIGRASCRERVRQYV